MLNKMSSKLTQFQSPNATSSRPPTQHPSAKSPSAGADWKKWGKRAAIGVAAVGALTLGMDVADGGLFDGAAATGGGGGDWGAGMDAQTAVDANAAQNALALQGQENASMLADPPGTTCRFLTWL